MNRILLLVVFAAGCSGSPTAPSAPVVNNPPTATLPPVVATPPPSTFTLTGQVTATNGGQGLAGITASISGYAPTTTSATGAFSLTLPPIVFPYRVGLTGPAILERVVNVPLSGSASVPMEAIRLDGVFDLNFYRQIVRNGFDGAGTAPITRQVEAPRIYLRTIDDAGAAIDAATLSATAAALINTAGSLTGKFGLAGMEQGTDTRQGQRGWITVRWSAINDQTSCGRAFIAGDLIILSPKTPGCRCAGGPAVRLRTVKHELGHALGFYHSSNPNDLMFGAGSSACDQNPSAREIYHAAIAYSRPNGNLDPDRDP